MAKKITEDCTKCKHFIYCESGKTYFHKLTGKKCTEFERSVKRKGRSR